MHHKVNEATAQLLELVSTMKLTRAELIESLTLTMISIALDATDGNNMRAAIWIEERMIPHIRIIRNELAKGGTTPPAVIEGKRIN